MLIFLVLLKELLKQEKKDAAEIKQKTEEINRIVQEASAELYQKAAQEQAAKQQAAGQSHEGSEKKAKGKVVDADYKVDDENKN